MPKQILDPQVITQIKKDLHEMRNGLLSDRVIALERAVDVILSALEA